jgi:hypothetical protein
VAASHHGDTPYSGNSVTPVPVTPYTTSVDVNGLLSQEEYEAKRAGIIDSI